MDTKVKLNDKGGLVINGQVVTEDFSGTWRVREELDNFMSVISYILDYNPWLTAEQINKVCELTLEDGETEKHIKEVEGGKI